MTPRRPTQAHAARLNKLRRAADDDAPPHAPTTEEYLADQGDLTAILDASRAVTEEPRGLFAETVAERRARSAGVVLAPVDSAETRRLDALERYVWALEEVVAQAAPDAPLLRGTWRPRSHDGGASLRDVRRYRCSVRGWRAAALALRQWMAALNGPASAGEER